MRAPRTNSPKPTTDSPRARELACADSMPGTALEVLRAAGHLEIVESYGPFDAPHRFNPCMRRVKNRSPVCSTWGFAVFRYTQNASNGHANDLARCLDEGNRNVCMQQWFHGVRKSIT